MRGLSSFRVFVVRLHDEGSDGQPRWRGRIELVGSEEGQSLDGTDGITEFIERHLRSKLSPSTGSDNRVVLTGGASATREACQQPGARPGHG